MKEWPDNVKDKTSGLGKTKVFATGVLIPLMILGGVYVLIKMQKNSNSAVGTKTICTQEAQLCPDGSSVGRTGPNCEFAECPIIRMTAQECIINGGDVVNTLSEPDYPVDSYIGDVTDTKCPCVCLKKQVISRESSTVSGSDTANWKTYRNEEYGFEVKYPERWTSYIEKQQEPHPVIYIVFYPEGATHSSEHTVSVAIYDDISLQKEFELDAQATEIFIGGKNAKRHEISAGGSSVVNIIIPLSGRFMVLSTTGKHESLFEEFLSTFKFTK